MLLNHKYYYGNIKNYYDKLYWIILKILINNEQQSNKIIS